MKRLRFLLLPALFIIAATTFGQNDLKRAMGPGPVVDPVASATIMAENVKTHVTGLTDQQYQQIYDASLKMFQDKQADTTACKTKEMKDKKGNWILQQDEAYKKILSTSQFDEWKKYMEDQGKNKDFKKSKGPDHMMHDKH